MGRRNKLKKFNEILSFTNVYENYDPNNPRLMADETTEVDLKGKWRQDHFKNDNPIVLELACGRGEYTLALGEANPNINYIGVDVKGARIWQGATRATDQGLNNVAFLRTRIEQIGLFFGENEVDEIWITFPDPFLKEGKTNRRLTSHPFLERYKPILKEGAMINLKTDDPTLYEFTQETFAECEFLDVTYDKDDIYSEVLDFPELEYKTYYENMHLKNGLTIKFIKAQLKA